MILPQRRGLRSVLLKTFTLFFMQAQRSRRASRQARALFVGQLRTLTVGYQGGDFFVKNDEREVVAIAAGRLRVLQ